MEDLASGDIVFAATGVTSGWFLNGVEKTNDYVKTHSLCASIIDGKRSIRNYSNQVFA